MLYRSLFAPLVVCSGIISWSILAATPVSTNGLPGQSFLGESVCFDANFTNAGDPGFGPYLRILTDSNLTLDSVSVFNSAQTITDVGEFTTGNSNTLTDPIADLSVTGTEGENLAVVRFPVGSVVANGPDLSASICITVAVDGAIGVGLPLSIQPGYEYGDTATGDNGPLIGTLVSQSLSPTIVAYQVSDNAGENERVPGSSFPVTVTHQIDAANSKTVFSLQVAESLSSNLQYTSPTTVTGGTNCAADAEPSLVSPGGTLSASCDDVTGGSSASDVTISYSSYVPDLLDETTCSTLTITNSATFDSDFPSGTSLAQLSSSTTFSAKHLAIQQSLSPATLVPGDVVTITDQIQLSEFASADSLLVTDILPDGLSFTSHSSMTVNSTTVTISPTVTQLGDDTTTVVYDIHNETGDLPVGTVITITYTATVQQSYAQTATPLFANDPLNLSSSAAYSLAAGAAACADTSSSSGSIAQITPSKSILSPQAEYTPGDAVTFRLTMEIPSGDTRQIVFEDFFPLPVFDVSDIDLTFGNDIVLASDDNAGLTPTSITRDTATNSITINWPDVNESPTTAKTIAVDITATIVSDPFADGLSLVNLFSSSTENTGFDQQSAVKNVALVVRAPDLTVTLDDDAAAVVDAGDQITYTLTVINSGGANAHDVTVDSPTIIGIDAAVLASVTVDGLATTAYTGTIAGGDFKLNDALAPIEELVITYTRDVSSTVNPQQVIEATSAVVWASNSGATKFPAQNQTKELTVAGTSISAAVDSVSPEGFSGNFVVGDTVTYAVTVTLPEGETPSLALDLDLPAGLEYVAASAAVNTSGFNGTVDSSPTVSTSGVVATGQTVAVAFNSPINTIVTGDNVTNNNAFTLTLDALVKDDAANSATATVQNKTLNSDLSYTGISGSSVTSSVSQSFAEHALDLTTSLSPQNGLQVGDTVTVNVSLENTGTAPAYDVLVSSAVNGDLFDLTTVAENATATNYTYAYSSPNVTFSLDSGTLGVDETVEFSYTAVVKNAVQTGAQFLVSADASGDSQDGELVPDRDTSDTGSKNANTANPSADSVSLLSTSESWTTVSGTPVFSIGEVATYSFTVIIPEGVSEDTSSSDMIEVTLPAGLQYLGGTANIRGAFNTGLSGSVSGTINSTDTAITPSFSSQVIGFDLGNITNSDNDADAEQIIVTFDVLILNTSDNNRTDSKTVTGRIHYNNQASVAQSNSASASSVIGVPNLSLSNIATPDSVEGGDSVSYTLTATNTSATNVVRGWEWLIEDALPSRLNTPVVVTAQLSRGATDIIGCASFSSNTLTVNSTCLTASERYLEAGESITVVYTVNIDASVGFEEEISTTADFSLTSLPGALGTADATPGAADSDTGERTGSQVNNTSGDAVNDLLVMSTEVVTSGAPTISLTASTANVQIGAGVTIEAEFAIPTGSTDNFIYTLDLPSGLTYSGGTIVITEPSSDYSAEKDPSTTITIGTDPILFDFGSITNSAAMSQLITVVVPVVVDNILANQNASGLTTAGSLSYQGVSSPAPSQDAAITVIEPNLSIVQTITAGATGSDAGDTISYQTVISNTSMTATAYRVDLSDVMPDGLLGAPDGTGSSSAFSNLGLTNTSDLVVLTGSATPAAVGDLSEVTTTNTGDTLLLATVDVPPSGSLTLTYDLVVRNGESAGQVLSNQVSATYNSMLTGSGRDGSTADSDDDDDSDLNNYNESDSSSVTLDDMIAVQVELNSAHASNDFTIGDSVTMDIRVDVIEGDINNLIVSNTLPTDLRFESSSISAGSNITFTGDANGTVDGSNVVSIDLATVSNESDLDTSNDFFVLSVVATVLDQAGNVHSTTLQNSASASGGGSSAGPDTLDLDIVEPNLTVDVTSNKDTVTLGDSVTFSVEVTPTVGRTNSFDTSLEVAIPDGLTYEADSFMGQGTLDDSDTTNLMVDLGTVVVVDGSKTFTFAATVDNDADIGNALTVNVANGVYSSLAGTDADERAYTFSGSKSVVGDTASFIAATQTVQIVNDLNGNGYADPGDTLRYTVALENTGADATGVVFTESIPDHTTYVAASLTTEQGTTDDTTGISVDIGTMFAASTVEIVFDVEVNAGVADGTLISAQGSVDSDITVSELTDANGNDANGDQANITRSGEPGTEFDDLYVYQSFSVFEDADSNSEVSPNDILTISYSIQNNGTSQLDNISLADLIPDGLTYVSSSAQITDAQSIVLSGDNVAIDVTSLASNGAIVASFNVTIDAPLVDNNGSANTESFTFTASHSSDQTVSEQADSNGEPADGYQALVVEVVDDIAGEPDLRVSETWTLLVDVDNDGNVDPGDTVRYSINAVNQGSASATGVAISQTTASNTAFVANSGKISQGAISSEDPYNANIGSIAPGGVVTGSFDVIVGSVADDTVISAQASISGNNFTTLNTDDNGNLADGVNPTLFIVTSASSAFETPTFTLTDTSNVGTSGNEFVQGETLDVQLIVTVPAGSFDNLSLNITLPSDTNYETGSALLARTFDTGLSSANDPGSINDAASTTEVDVSSDVTSSGQLVSLALASVVNSDSDVNDELYTFTITIETDDLVATQLETDLLIAAQFSYFNGLDQLVEVDASNVMVTLLNQSPVANNDSPAVLEDADTAALDILGNDTDADVGQTIIVSAISSIDNGGSVSIVSGGAEINYQPAVDFYGTETIVYQISDGVGGTDTANVQVSVTAQPDDPVATADSQTINEEQSVEIDVLDNDFDVDGDTLTVQSASADSGTVTINGSNNLVYTPATDDSGTATITYIINDGTGLTATSTVTVTITEINDAPVVTGESGSVDEDNALTINVLTNDSDADSDPLSITALTSSNGTVSADSSGNVTYTPPGDYNGSATISYTVSDGRGGSNSATVAVTVNSINDTPVSTVTAGSTDEDTPVIIDVLGGASDVDGDTLSISGLSADTGTVTINDDGHLVYTPATDFNGSATITLTISDGNGGSVSVTITVTVSDINDAPVVTGESGSVDEDNALTINVLSNDTDADSDPLSITALTSSNGTVSADSSGNVTYTPPGDYNGSATISYTVSDGRGGSNSATVAVTVNAVNDAPVSTVTAGSTDEDTPVIIDVLGGASDVDGDTLSISGLSADTGTVTINDDGHLVYTPATDFNGSATITLTISDGNGGSVSVTITVTVSDINDAPVVTGESGSVDEDNALTINVLSNDTDADSDPLSITALTSSNGTVSADSSGNVTYTPPGDYNGSATISYTVSDGRGGSNSATVAVTVNAVNDTPVSTVTAGSTDEDTPVIIDVLGGASDVDGDTLSISGLSADTGTVTINDDGHLVYTPATDFNGSATITLTISDGNGGSVPVTITVTVSDINDAPVVTGESGSVDEDNALTINVLSNDTDADSDPLSITALTSSNGTVSADSSGNVTYTPPGDYNGSATISYTVSDGRGGSNSATVAVTVNAVNDTPVSTVTAGSTDEDTPVIIDVLGGASDVDGDTLSISGLSVDTGTVTINDDGHLVYTPATDFNGSATITLTISDGNGGSVSVTITVTVSDINDAPVVTGESGSVDEDNALTINVLTNDSDADSDPLSITALTSSNGTVSADSSGNVTYTPPGDYNGSATISYTVSDGRGGSNSATVAVTVNAVNDTPVSTVTAGSTDEDTPVIIDVLGGASDVDGDTLSISGLSVDTGTVTINDDGHLVYTPATDFNGSATITLTISDGNGGSVSVTITVTVSDINDAPVVTGESGSVDEDNALTINVLTNDTDADSDPLSITALTSSNGTVSADSSGNVTYTPPGDYNGSATISYTVSDGRGGSNSATVAVTVNAVNDAPVSTVTAGSTDEDTPVIIDVLGGASDVDGDTLSISGLSVDTGTVTINDDGHLVYTPATDFNGSATITLTISDGNGGSVSVTITVTVSDINDAPVVTGESGSVDEDNALTINVLSNDTDADSDPLSITALTSSNGTVSADSSGNVTYTPPGDYNGSATISYTVSDGRGGSNSATVAVTVNSINDTPVSTVTAGSTDEDTPVIIDVLGGASDVDGDTLNISGLSVDTGTVTINDDGHLVYTPTTDFNGSATITLTISDGNGGSVPVTITVTVSDINDAPVVTGESGSVDEDNALTINVLTNDSDADSDPLSITALTSSNGTVSADSSGNVTYTPPGDYNGSATISYTVSDGRGGSNSATVAVTVNAVNDTPVSTVTAGSTDEDTPVIIDVLGGASDVDGDTLSISGLSVDTGTVTINDDGYLVYTPATDFNGSATITLTISDGNGGSVSVTITVTVSDINDAPVVTGESGSVDEDNALTINVLTNDTDADSDPLSITALTSSNGTVSADSSGNVTYTPPGDYNGSATISYTVSDGRGGSNSAAVAVTVNSINDTPVSTVTAGSTDEDTPVIIDVLGGASDVDGDTLSISGLSVDTGTVTINDDGHLVYTPATDFNGSATITLTISDGNGGSVPVTITVTVSDINDAPVVTGESGSVDEDNALTINVLSNDTDADSDPLSITALTSSNGTVSADSSGNVTYTPPGDYNGSATISYTVSDGRGGSNSATVAVTVNAVNDTPVSTVTAGSTDEDTPLIIDVLGGASDVDGDTLSISGLSVDTGTVTINDDGHLVYTPTTDFNGSATITLTISDGNGGSVPVTITVTVSDINDAPVVTGESGSVDEDNALTINVLTNDTDADSDPLSITALTSSNGTVSADSSGNVTYTPPGDYNGSATISYTVSDGRGGSNSAAVAVTVNAVNDNPVSTVTAGSTDEDTPVIIDVLGGASDVDGDTLSISGLSVDTGTVTINDDGHLVYTPATDFNGSATLTLTISDGNGGSVPVTITVDINAQNDAPVLPSITRSTDEDVSISIDVVGLASDADDDSLTVSALTATNGTATIDPAGNIVFSPTADFNGEALISYTIIDGNEGSTNGVITMTVNAVNDAPVSTVTAGSTDEDTPVIIDVLGGASDVDGDTLSISGLSVDTGTVTINDDGHLVYTPATDFNGSATLTLTISDGNGGSVPVTITVDINAQNDAPVLPSITRSTDEDVSISIDVVGLASDADDDSLTVSALTATNGTATIDPAGNIVFSPTADFNGEALISYTITDGNEGSTNGVITMTVNSVNDAPVSTVTAGSTDEDTPVIIDVLGGASDVDGDTLSISGLLVDTGTVTINDDGHLVYTPATDFNGSATLTLTISDGNGGSVPVTITVDINAQNDAPVLPSITRTTDEDVSITIDVVGLASDADDDTLTVSALTATNGTATIDPAGNIVFSPTADFNGEALISYTITDGNEGSTNGVITVTVTSVNDLPAYTLATVNVEEDESVTLDLLGSASDVDGDTLIITSATALNGTVEIIDGTLVYSPDENFYGNDTISFVIDDGNGGVTSGTIVVSVAENNDLPVIPEATFVIDEDTSLTFDVLATVTDSDGDEVSIFAFSSDDGVILINADNSLEFTPAEHFNGVVTFSVTVKDARDGTTTRIFSVTVNSVNDLPVIGELSATTDLLDPVIIDILGAAEDADGDEMAIDSAVSSSGMITINNDGTITFVANEGFEGNASVTVCVSDTNDGQTCTSFVVEVNNPNVAPELQDVFVNMQEDGSLPLDLAGFDVDGDALTYTLLSEPTGELIGDLPNVIFNAENDFSGEVSFTYQAYDGQLDSNIATVTIQIGGENDTPIAKDDFFELIGSEVVQIDVLVNDSDPDGDALKIVGAVATIGDVTFDDEMISYTPFAGFVGNAIVTYTIEDPSGDSASARVLISPDLESIALLPQITVPEDVFVDANALFTKIDLGVASAVDRFGNPLPVSLLDGITFYEPGVNTAFWIAEDAEGNRAIASQFVRVRPLVSIDKDQAVLEGRQVKVGVHLNGTSPVYPLEIPYTVSGNSDESDHNLTNGTLVLESGSNAYIKFETFTDDIVEHLETVVITLSDSINLGNNFEHTVTIHEDNVNPDIKLFANQDGDNRVVINRNGGVVLVTSDIIHPDPNNEFEFTWRNLEELIEDTDTAEDTFTFNPTNLAVGVYRITVSIVDLDDPDFNDSETLYLEVRDSLPILSDIDSDKDGIPDNVEGLADSDRDGIPDYLDPIPECNVLPEEAPFVDGYLVEGDPGVCLRIGNFAITGKDGGAKISPEDIAADTVLTEDPDATNIGGIFDFIAYGLPDEGQAYKIAMPQIRPVPENAVYRKFFSAIGWFNFVASGENKVWSTAGEPGYCPPPGGSVWIPGLNAGHWCVQIQIVDGGPNDADGLANGTIVDPGGVGVLGVGINRLPVAHDDLAELLVDTTIIIDVLSNDTDADGDILTVTSATALFGTVTFNDTQVIYTPRAGFSGNDQIQYGITDGNGGTDLGAVSLIVITNQAPVTTNDTASVMVNQSVVIDVLANDTDADGDPLTIVSATANNGTLIVNNNNTVTYIPNTDVVGNDTITYLISDGEGGSAEGTVTVTINPELVRIKNSGGGSTNFLIPFILLIWLVRLLTTSNALHRRIRDDI